MRQKLGFLGKRSGGLSRGFRLNRRTPGDRPHLIYLAIGFPPAAKSCAYRMRETANQFCAQGWDVTVVTISQEAWEREYGLDHTLSAGVDPRVEIVELPLVREDLETDIRAFSEARSLNPQQWIKDLRERALKSFPEPVFGGWRDALEEGLLRVHRARPADLLLTTCAPYVNIAATRRLWKEAGVPYAMDFRDGWSVDVIGGGEAFARSSVSGRWESELLADAVSIWFVNDPIIGFYRERYPELVDKMRVVRNGYDQDSVPAQPQPADPSSRGHVRLPRCAQPARTAAGRGADRLAAGPAGRSGAGPVALRGARPHRRRVRPWRQRAHGAAQGRRRGRRDRRWPGAEGGGRRAPTPAGTPWC